MFIISRILHPSEPPLDIGATYTLLRESIIQCELFLMRALGFQVTIIHPHKACCYVYLVTFSMFMIKHHVMPRDCYVKLVLNFYSLNSISVIGISVYSRQYVNIALS